MTVDAHVEPSVDRDMESGRPTGSQDNGLESVPPDIYHLPLPQVDSANTEVARKHCSNSVESGWSRLCKRLYPAGFFNELWITLKLAWPLILSQFSQFGLQPITIAFAGRLGKIELDAIGMATSMINILGQVTVMGMATAAETFFTQSFGENDKKKIGIILQRAVVIQMLALFPIWSLFLNIDPILRSWGQHPDVTSLVARYLIIFMPGVMFLFLYYILRRYLECQNIVVPNLVIGCVSLAALCFFQWLFVYNLALGLDGSALAQNLTYFLMFALTFGYIYFTGIYKDGWEGWSFECLRDWSSYLRLAIPGICMTGFSWWSCEVTLLLAGVMGKTELAAQSIMFQLDPIQSTVTTALGCVEVIRVGQSLGAGDSVRAKTAAHVGLTIAMVFATFCSVLFFTTKKLIPRIFTDVPEVVSLVSELVPVISIYTFFDSFTQVAKGVYRGAGKQSFVSILVFVTFVLMALPLGASLMFLTPLKLTGCWLAYCCGYVVTALVFFVTFTCFIDWDTLVKQAKERLGGFLTDTDLVVVVPKDGAPQEKTPLLDSASYQRPATSDVTSSTALMRSTSQRTSATALLSSTSLHSSYVSPALSTVTGSHESTKSSRSADSVKDSVSILLFKRILVLVIFVLLFVVSIAVHFLVPLDAHRISIPTSNRTLSHT